MHDVGRDKCRRRLSAAATGAGHKTGTEWVWEGGAADWGRWYGPYGCAPAAVRSQEPSAGLTTELL